MALTVGSDSPSDFVKFIHLLLSHLLTPWSVPSHRAPPGSWAIARTVSLTSPSSLRKVFHFPSVKRFTPAFVPAHTLPLPSTNTQCT